MTIGENIGLDRNPLAQRALAGEPGAVDLGRDTFYDHAAPAVGNQLRRGGRLDGRGTEPPSNRRASHWYKSYPCPPPPLRGEGRVGGVY